jgi:GntR family transcriptional repressor for pyruvate dehydrogenase complex
MIRQGDFVYGQKLPAERELIELFAVSRSTIRDAIQKLSVLGYVEVRQGDGTMVRMPDRDTLAQPFKNLLVSEPHLSDDLLMFRRLLEPEVSRLAAEHCTKDDAEILSKCLTRQSKVAGNKDHFSREDYVFHQEIAKISRNTVVLHQLDTLHALLIELRQTVLAVSQPRLTLKHHANIADAIINHEAERARIAMIEHLDWVISASRHTTRTVNQAKKLAPSEPKAS